jgi:hypothetical protein
MSRPDPRWGIAAVYVLIFAAGALGSWSLRGFAVQSGDHAEYSQEKRYSRDVPIYHIREPGAVLLWQAFAWGSRGVMHGRDSMWGMLTPEDRARGFDLLGAFCGGLFLVFLAAYIRGAPSASGGRKALAAAVVLFSAITWTFVGHIEFYAPLYAGLMFFYWRASRHFLAPSERTFFWMILAAWAAVAMHRVALFHLPALALVWAGSARPLRWIRPTQTQVVVVLGFVIVACVTHVIPVFVAAAFNAPILVFEDYNWLPELITPMTQGWAEYVRENSRLGSSHKFLFGSYAHASHFFFFVMVASPLGVPVAILLRRQIRGRWPGFLLAAAAAGWLWAIFWHPHLSYGDWDLFVNPGLPTNLLAASLILGETAEKRGTQN